MTTSARVSVAGPYFDELERGHVERAAPALTLTEGHAAVHQAILGGRLRLALDAPLAHRVCGTGSSATSRSASPRCSPSG